MGEIVVQLLDENAIDRFWPQISAEMDNVPHLWSERFTKDAVHFFMMNKQFQVWGAAIGGTIVTIVVTQIAVFPRCRILETLFAFGNSLDNVLPEIVAKLEYFARCQNCTYVDIIGRKGWAKKLKPYGVREVGIVLRADVGYERMN